MEKITAEKMLDIKIITDYIIEDITPHVNNISISHNIDHNIDYADQIVHCTTITINELTTIQLYMYVNSH